MAVNGRALSLCAWLGICSTRSYIDVFVVAATAAAPSTCVTGQAIAIGAPRAVNYNVHLDTPWTLQTGVPTLR